MIGTTGCKTRDEKAAKYLFVKSWAWNGRLFPSSGGLLQDLAGDFDPY